MKIRLAMESKGKDSWQKSVEFSRRLYTKSCTLGHTDRAYLNSRQQCPLTSGWTMLNSLCLIRWLTLQRRQGRSLICNWAVGGQTHRISSTHWALQLASECVCVRAHVRAWDCSMLPEPPKTVQTWTWKWPAAAHSVSCICYKGLHWKKKKESWWFPQTNS